MSDRNLEELLPWYANGTLEESERKQVEAWLEDNPEAQLQLAEIEFLNETVSEVGEQEAVMREDLFDDLLERIETEETQAANELQRDQAPSMMERLQNWFNETFQWGMTPQFAKVAVVSQFAVVMALGAVLIMPTADEGYEVLSGGDPVVVDAGIQLDIGVKPDLTIGQFQALLKAQQAMIVSGPNSLGIYRISLPQGSDVDQALATLKAGEGVIYLQRVEP
ncbi:MAG: hypothetical protein OQK12_05945 [Motiliproteus sp.]|nr:hypothetical protein [Motiliproteus sp.]MCW9051707.1 hypothetical protein [Motiliproteus sp.]